MSQSKLEENLGYGENSKNQK